MDKVLNLSEEAINRYFTTLSQFGYKNYTSVDQILALFFIEELLNGTFSQFMTEEDYQTIVNSLYCLVGSDCMISFPTFASYDSLMHKTHTDPLRITQDSILRNSTNENLRIEA